MSLNVVPPARAFPSSTSTRRNDEVYVIVGGRGQFLVDDECIDVEEGSTCASAGSANEPGETIRMPPLYFLCIQYRADSVIQGGTLDGQGVEGKPTWPN